MAYFDPSTVIVDANSSGLEALLTQDGRVISYASRALSPVESRYSQTEREMLPIIWAIQHYHLYLYGAKLLLLPTTSRCLETNQKKPPEINESTDRPLEAETDLMPDVCEILYKPGKDAENPADFISRHPNDLYTPPVENATEAYVNYLCNTLRRSSTRNCQRSSALQTLRSNRPQQLA